MEKHPPTTFDESLYFIESTINKGFYLQESGQNIGKLKPFIITSVLVRRDQAIQIISTRQLENVQLTPIKSVLL